MDLKVQRDPVMEHAVVLSLRMVDDSREELDQLSELAFNIESALTKIAGGEFGGVDAGAGFCLLYCYGADAEEVFTAISPLLDEFSPKPGSWAIKRFGSATDLSAIRQRVDLGIGA